MTEGILHLMKQRRMDKDDKVEYTEIKEEIKDQMQQSKKERINAKSKEIED